jgi:hypothetical protein
MKSRSLVAGNGDTASARSGDQNERMVSHRAVFLGEQSSCATRTPLNTVSLILIYVVVLLMRNEGTRYVHHDLYFAHVGSFLTCPSSCTQASIPHTDPRCHVTALDACNVATDMLLYLSEASPEQLASALPSLLKWQDATLSLREELRSTTPPAQESTPCSFKKRQESAPSHPVRGRSPHSHQERGANRGRRADSYSRSRGRVQYRDRSRSRSLSRLRPSRSRSRDQQQQQQQQRWSRDYAPRVSRSSSSRDQVYHAGRDTRHQVRGRSRSAGRSRSLERLVKQMKAEAWTR